KHLYSYLYYFIYFSFTVLTTLGFGDIMPASHWSRMVTSMEAVLGQLYLVVMVTYLIGLHLNERNNKHSPE
ncbi:MAG: potassium channel family protein, partial [Deltaproteobacteria bacterium]|nr:potassium channel family protein [Deltaproteobacteria bacterium]